MSVKALEDTAETNCPNRHIGSSTAFLDVAAYPATRNLISLAGNPLPQRNQTRFKEINRSRQLRVAVRGGKGCG
jgi:hypothetical protein